MPRFVVLAHDWPEPHFDLLLEGDEACRTWRLAAEPKGEVAAERIADHRMSYLDYEGPVSDERGTVKRWDGGTYREFIVIETPRETVIEFSGRKLTGLAIWSAETLCWTFPGD